jgi:hypothetical protein
MRMRTALIGCVITAAMVAGFSFGQDAPQSHRSDSTQLLADLRSNDPRARVGAFEQIRSNSAMLQDPSVRSALLDLLDLETREFNERVREGERRRAEHKEGNPESSDDNAMYMNDLLETVESFVNWHDPREVCLLAKEGAALDSPDAREGATRAQVALPCLQQLSKSELFSDRSKAVRTSAALLAGAIGSLDPTTAEAMRQIVRLALHDHRVEVQWEAVESLERDGAPDMIPVLREFAESSPGPNATEDEIAVRKSAAKAIIVIQQGERQK